MEPLKRFRVMTVQLSLLVMAVIAAVLFKWDPRAAQGLLLGGIAGVVVFWWTALRAQRLAEGSKRKLYSRTLAWTGLGLLVYGLALGRAYTLDTETLHGFLAAAGGLFIVRVVVVFLGVSGLDLKKEEK